MKNIASLFFFLLAFTAKGQYSSVNGWFTVDEVQGCTGLTINITFVPSQAPCICGDTGCPCDFDYEGDGTYDSKSSPLTSTFTQPGNYTLEVLFPSPNGSDYIDIEVTDNVAPNFNLYSCSGEAVVVDISDSKFDNYVVDFDDGTVVTIPQGASDPQHTYAGNIPRTIEVRGLNNNAADNCVTAANTVTPVATISQPAITALTMQDNSSLVLEYNLQPDIYYELQISPSNSGNYSFLKQVDANTTTDTIRNLNLSGSYFCFRIAAKDRCSNIVASFSNTICSINLDLSIASDVNQLTWNTATPDVNFSLRRDDLLIRPVAATARSFDDTEVDCNTSYCYTLIANYTNGYTSTSLPVCGTSFSTSPPDQVQNISTVVNNDVIQLSWEVLPSTSIYQIQKADNGSTFSTINTSQSNAYEDPGPLTSEKSYCYQIGSTDVCGNSTGQSITACSILLSGNIDSDNIIQLTWNDYSGWQNGVKQYMIEKSYPSGGTTATASSNTTTYSETDNNSNQQIIEYKITAVPNDAGLASSVSNIITIIKPPNIYYPNAFTPDGNGTNETFKIHGKFITDYELRVYDRWGELIFYSKNLDEGWDGTREGKILPQGTYAFRADMQDMAGHEITRTGTILLLRR